MNGSTRSYSVLEASYLSDAKRAWIYREMEQGVVTEHVVGKSRMLDEPDVIYLASIGPMVTKCTVGLKREIRNGVCKALRTGARTFQFYNFLLDLEQISAQVESRRLELKRSREDMVERVPGVCGGEPVLRGTRFPVRLVASLLAQGVTEAEFADEYGLTPQQVHAAAIYMSVYPPRGRPRKTSPDV